MYPRRWDRVNPVDILSRRTRLWCNQQPVQIIALDSYTVYAKLIFAANCLVIYREPFDSCFGSNSYSSFPAVPSPFSVRGLRRVQPNTPAFLVRVGGRTLIYED